MPQKKKTMTCDDLGSRERMVADMIWVSTAGKCLLCVRQSAWVEWDGRGIPAERENEKKRKGRVVVRHLGRVIMHIRFRFRVFVSFSFRFVEKKTQLVEKRKKKHPSTFR